MASGAASPLQTCTLCVHDVLIPLAEVEGHSARTSVAGGLVTIGFDHPSSELLHCSVPSLGPVLVGFKIQL